MPLRSMKRFIKQSGGTATVETVLWFPLIIAIFGLMLDVAMIFHGQAKVLRIVQDANREFSIGRITTTASTETTIENNLTALGITATATTTQVAGTAFTVVDVPANQLQVLGYFSAFSGLSIQVADEYLIENWEV